MLHSATCMVIVSGVTVEVTQRRLEALNVKFNL